MPACVDTFLVSGAALLVRMQAEAIADIGDAPMTELDQVRR